MRKMRPVNTLQESDKQVVATCKPSKDHVKNYLVGLRDPNIVYWSQNPLVEVKIAGRGEVQVKIVSLKQAGQPR